MRMLKELELSEEEYKRIYLACPSVYDTPIESWADFKRNYEEKSEAGTVLPSAPFSNMEIFDEEEFFEIEMENMDITLVRHARYAPAFWHELEFIKFVCVLHGSGTFYINHRELKMKAGSFCIVGPKVRQAFFANHDGDVIVNIIMRHSTFKESFSALLKEQGVMTDFLWRMLYNRDHNMALVYAGEKDPVLQERIKELCYEILSQKTESNLIRKSLFLIVCDRVLRNHANELEFIGRKNRDTPFYIPAILTFMREHIDTITLGALAEEFQLSEAYLSRYIRKETGDTYSYLVNDLRMKRAKELLKKTDFSVEKIIETVGYTEKSRFYRSFKMKFGVSPIKYRKNNQLVLRK